MTDNNETVTLKRGELSQMLEEAVRNAMSKQNFGGEVGTKEAREARERLRKPEFHTAKLRRVDDKYVIGYKNRGTDQRPKYIYERQDPEDKNRKVTFVDLILAKNNETPEEEHEIVPINLNEFIRESDVVVCKILKKHEIVEDYAQGETSERDVDFDNYRSLDTGRTVPVIIEQTAFDYTFELPEGGELTVNQMIVNI